MLQHLSQRTWFLSLASIWILQLILVVFIGVSTPVVIAVSALVGASIVLLDARAGRRTPQEAAPNISPAPAHPGRG